MRGREDDGDALGASNEVSDEVRLRSGDLLNAYRVISSQGDEFSVA